MKKWMFLPIVMVFAGCAPATPSQSRGVVAPAAKTAATATAAQDNAPARDEGHKVMDTTIPANFSPYATAQIGDGERCVAGASTDDDGLNQKPVLYVSAQDQKQVQWSQTLPLPADTYQSRATHCLATHEALYVLLQSDTQPEQTLSQTLLRVLKIDPRNGAVLASMDVVPAGVADAYSAWVEEGPENFRLHDGKLVVSGKFYRLADAEERKSFQVELNAQH